MSPGFIRCTVERARRAGLVAMLVTVAALPVPGRASDGRISFTGAVVTTSCVTEFKGEFSISLGGCVTGTWDTSAATPARVVVQLDDGRGAYAAVDGLIDPATGNLELEFHHGLDDTDQASANSAVVVSLVYH